MSEMMTIMSDEPWASSVFPAVEGSRNPDQQRIAEVGLKWLDLILRKNRDYGGSAWSVPALCPHMSTGDAILVRMSDKIARLKQLKENGDHPQVDESFDDTIRDLGAYCLLYLARPKAPLSTDIVSVNQ